MSTAMLLDRGSMSMPGAVQFAGSPSAMPGAGPNWCAVPRCTMRAEKCKGGMKLYCSCEDEVACGALQNLCKMFAEGTCNFCCTFNGICVCQCNLVCGTCKWEATKDGCCFTCISGDKACCDMIQACCDCLSGCLEAGCCCTASLGGTPICCGCC